MNANIFFILTLLFFAGVYLFFKPMHIQHKAHGEVPQLELYGFSLYNIEESGLKSILKAETGRRYSDRYEIDRLDFTDARELERVGMQADHGVYKEDVITLEGGVVCTHGDTMRFESEEARYDTNRTIATTQGPFHVYYQSHSVEGAVLYYDVKNRLIKAEKIKGSYYMEES